MDMRELIKKLLKEYTDEYIQNVDFDGFSEPILIPQFNMYIVKFNGTGRVEKVSDSEKIVFRDKGGKEYIFDSNDVQKSGSGPFYISLDVLRRNYDIRFKDDFVRYKKTLTQNQIDNLFRLKIKDYLSDRACKTTKCEDLRNEIESSLKDMYGKNYGTYVSNSCEPVQGFLNIYPIEGTSDSNGNEWSKLNYVIFMKESISVLVLAYIKKYGTLEHGDFIEWIKEDKERLFKGPFFDAILKNMVTLRTKNRDLMVYIKQVFPDSKLIDSFCPTTRNEYTETISIMDKGTKIVFQPVNIKHRVVFNFNGKYYLSFAYKDIPPNINRKADYIITNNGTIYKNSNVIRGKKVWEFDEPPIFTVHETITELTGADKNIR
jgi:hypothetical protein